MPYRHDYDKILTRLITILSRLNEGEALSVTELVEEFNVSVRTIQRDFNERLVSFPIYQEKKRWKMQEGYRIEKSRSIEEELVLAIIEKIAEGIGGSFFAKAHTLLSKIKNEDFNPIYTKLNIEDISDRFGDLQCIEQAIREKRVINCSYNDERRPAYTTKIKPLKVANFEGFWYLIALNEDTLKKYYLKNLANLTLTEETFVADSALEALLENAFSIWFQPDIEPFEVKLYADKVAAKYFKRRPLPTQKIESLCSDGTMIFSVRITHRMEILSVVKYWIPHLLIVEPAWLKEKIEEDIESYLGFSKDTTFS